MKKITFETPSLYYDDAGKMILDNLLEALGGKPKKKKKNEKSKK